MTRYHEDPWQSCLAPAVQNARHERGSYHGTYRLHLQISGVHSYRSHDCFRVARIEPRTPNTSKISRHFVPGGDAAELLRLQRASHQGRRHVNAAVKITCIQEIGFDGFGSTHIYRMLDKKHNTLVYLAVSSRISGSPANSISSVPIMPWGSQ